MVLKGLGVLFIVIVAAAFSVGVSGTETELYLIVPNSDVIINPGSKEVLNVIPRYLDSSYQPVENPVKKNVSVTFTLSDPGERPLCLSKEGDNGTDSDCSSCSVTIQGTESFSLVISYSLPVNEAFIEKDKVFHLDVSSNDLHNPTVELQRGITITTRDSRRLQVGFSGVLHRRFVEGSNLTVKQFNTSRKIASKLDVTVSIFEPADGESRKFNGSVTIQQLKEETDWTIPLPSYLDRTKSYLLNLSTELTEVHLSPCELRVYPSEQEVKCAELADNVRSLMENNTQSLDQVNIQSLDQVRSLLIDMCDVIKEAPPTTSPPPTCPSSPPPACPATTCPSPPPTSPPPACPPTTCPSPPPTSPPPACPPTTCPSPSLVNTTQDATSVAETGSGVTSGSGFGEISTATEPPTATENESTTDTTTPSPSTSEESTDTTLLELGERAEDISVMWWAFFVFLALLILGVSGYLLFNHHAKVKVYLFQLVGKGGSTVSASYRSRSATAKYTPLPTNVRDTMLHQD